MIIIADISIVLCLTARPKVSTLSFTQSMSHCKTKGEHTELYTINKNVYIKKPKIIILFILYIFKTPHTQKESNKE